MPTITTYNSDYGVFMIPRDVLARAVRLRLRFGRGEYLNEWCARQYQLAQH
jgi:hypothetical protein